MKGEHTAFVNDASPRDGHAPRLRGACLLTLAWCFLAGDLALAQTLPARTATVISLTGELSVRRSRSSPQIVNLHETIQPGDELITGPTGEAVVQSPDGSTVRIFPASRVIYSEQSRDIQEWLHLFFGSIKVHIEKLSGRPNPHNMTTPTAVIAVRGTTFSVFVDETDSTLVAVDEGAVAVANRRSPADEVLLQRGQRTWVRGDQPPLRAQAFRGRSDRADLIPWRSGTAQNAMGTGMGDRGGDHAAGGMTGSQGSMTGGMSARPGPPH